MSDAVQDYLESGKYLPRFIQGFHDQKAVFKYIDVIKERSIEKNGGSYMTGMSWVDSQVYTIDIFLWVMARHGYTLQRSRKKLPFQDIWKTVKEDQEKRISEMTSFLEKSTMTHTIYDRGRRAAERGAPKSVPSQYANHEDAIEWLRGYNSIYGGRIPPTIQDAINVLIRAENGNMDKSYAINRALDILEELV